MCAKVGCGYKNRHRSNFERHIRTQSHDYDRRNASTETKHRIAEPTRGPDGKFKCDRDNCGYKTKRRSDLKRHIETVSHASSSIKRPSAKMQEETKLTRNRGRKENTSWEKGKFICSTADCEYRTRFRRNLERHCKTFSHTSLLHLDLLKATPNNLNKSEDGDQEKTPDNTESGPILIKDVVTLSTEQSSKSDRDEKADESDPKNKPQNAIIERGRRKFKCNECDYSAALRHTLYEHKQGLN